MDALVASRRSRIPDSVPVVMKTVAREWLEGRRPGPEVIVDTAWNRFRGRMPDRVTPLKAQPAREIDLADDLSIVKPLDGLLNGGRRADLRAMLNDTIVFLGSAHELAAFPKIVRAGLFDVHIFARLARPDGDERVPVIWRGDRDGVYGFIFEQLAHIHKSLRVAVHLSAPFVQDFWSMSQSAAISTFGTRE